MKKTGFLSVKMTFGALATLALISSASAFGEEPETRSLQILDPADAPAAEHRLELVRIAYRPAGAVWVSKNCVSQPGARPAPCEALRSLDHLDEQRLAQDVRKAENTSGGSVDPSEILCATQVPSGQPVIYFDPRTGDQDRICVSMRDHSSINAGALVRTLDLRKPARH
jgi:hypothetical protein